MNTKQLKGLSEVATIAMVTTGLIISGARSATKYLSPTLVVRVVRKAYQGKFATGKWAPLELVTTVGRPNYLEREFIKNCRRWKEPFPVRKIQLKFLPKRRPVKRPKVGDVIGDMKLVSVGKGKLRWVKVA